MPSNANGARVLWDLGHLPFPEIPLPNDVATWPDPTSATGVRVNASLLAHTQFERNLRRQFDEMDGWGTFMPITAAFDDDLDLTNLVRRHGRDDSDFTNDAVYLIDLETGEPVPLDIGGQHFPLTLAEPNGIFPNDPRAGGSNLVFSTVNEDRNGDGILQIDEDTNFDGVMQRTAVYPPFARIEDGLATFWDAEARTLVLRPLIPLKERHRYAVVLTDRLLDVTGSAVRSPFETIAHPTQLPFLTAMRTHLANNDLSQRFYGGLQWDGTTSGTTAQSRVTFAWTFITQTTVSDLFQVYDGLHGTGRLARLNTINPRFQLAPLLGGVGCEGVDQRNTYVIPAARLQMLFRDLLPALGFEGQLATALIQSFDWVDYVAIGTYKTPYLLGDPRVYDPDGRWHLDQVANGAPVHTDDVQVWMFVPKTTGTARPPFPVAFNAHGYSSGAIQTFAFAGYFARLGIASVGINAPAHGLPISASQTTALRTFVRGMCLGPFGNIATAGRARDINGDGTLDSGTEFLTAHIFHTRDMFRQTALDYFQLSRLMTDGSWSMPGSTDYNGDGRMDAIGDFNGDGTVDLGGQRDGNTVPFYLWGESLGGITTMIAGAVDPVYTALSPVSGGAGLVDVSLRSTINGVVSQVLGPAAGPMVIGVPASQRAPRNNRTRTSCVNGELSLRWVVPDVGGMGELEFACMRLGQGLNPGDDIVVYNENNEQERCARVGSDGKFFIPVATDRGDHIRVFVYPGSVITDFGTCARPGDARPTSEVRTFNVGEGDCDESCGHVPPGAVVGSPSRMSPYLRGAALVSPAYGVGLRRQTSALRRFLQLAQAGIDPADPASFAPYFHLRPRDGRPRPMLTMTTIGDTLVATASGNMFARAAGLLPFLNRVTGSSLDDYATPAAILSRYSNRSPEEVLISSYVFEGLSRLNRTPARMNAGYLLDPDDLDQGLAGYQEQNLSPPLRLVRAAAPVRMNANTLVSESTAATEVTRVWAPTEGPISGFINAYVEPRGTHTFLPSDPSRAWDVGNYLTNLVARYFQTNGREILYYSNPTGHQCLEDSSCSFFPRSP